MEFMGKSKFTTWSTLTPPKSSPRAARSVQISTTALPSSWSPSTKSHMAAVRPSTVMSPLYITTGSSASFSAYSTAWHDGIVLQNTITLEPDRKSEDTICSSTAILSMEPGQSMKRCLRLGAERCREDVTTVCRSGSSSEIILATLAAMVAETMTHCLPAGLFLSGRSRKRMSSPNPASNSVSASSKMMWLTLPRYRLPSSTCLTRRPGVPTTTSRERSSISFCTLNFSPPMISSELKRAWCDTDLATPSTCSASSRVGPTMSTLGRLFLARPPPVSASARRICWITGRRYVSVLPLPVCDATM
mmetsp:Transcript_5345/g.13632  ORF Transcript_5345/g.13632 Transcript_5345/m.13632 type:complete len:304 (+) Transcript_5345:268-1179(+)